MNKELKEELEKIGITPNINGLILLIMNGSIDDKILKLIDQEVLDELDSKGYTQITEILKEAQRKRFCESVAERGIYEPEDNSEYEIEEFMNDFNNWKKCTE